MASVAYRAAQVTGRKLGGSPSGSVSLFFGGVIGTPEFETQLNATAAFMNRDLVLVIDRSDSMAFGAFLYLQRAVGVFLQTLRDNQTEERVGLVSFAQTVYYHRGLTVNMILAAVGTKQATVVVKPAVISNSSPSVTVRITLPIKENSWVPLHFVGDANLKARCTLHRETF